VESHLHALISYLSAHPHLGLGAIFAASLLEAVAVIGTFIPGSSVVFVGGVLVGLKVLDPAWTTAAAVIGAILGDGVSYWLGRRYHDRIRTLGPFRRNPALFDRGQAYFAQNGGWSVFVGRFLGPLRAIVPVVAGMSDMPPTRFYIVNVLSALAWVVAHLAPGVLFGASLQLAGAISSRLVVLLILVVGAGWLLSRLVRLIHGRLQPVLVHGRDRIVMWARTGSSPAQRVVLALFDPQRPESAALLAAAVVLVASAWLFFGILEDVLSNDPLVQVDRTVFAVLQSVRSGWADSLMVAATEVGSAAVALPVIVAVALLLAARRCWRTLAYWLAAMGFAQVLVWVLKLSIGRARPSAIYSGIEQFSFPSGHAASSIVLYGFLAFLLGRGQSARIKVGLSAAAASVIGLIAFSRIYLGAHWFSDVLASLSFGLAWVALLGIAYAHHAHDERLPARWLAAVSLGTMTLAAGVYVGMRHEADVARYAHRPEHLWVLLANWSTLGWRTLPAARSDVGGDVEEPLALQWAATEQEISAVLVAAGWRVPSPWALNTALLWLLAHPPIQQLPVLPKFHQGEVQSIALTKAVDSRQRLVVRLWPSGHVVDPTATGSPKPLWLGAVTIEWLQHPAGVFTIAATDPDFRSPLRLLERELVDQAVAVEHRDRQGFPALLAW
jgi:membrane protein DedA with SNARE-associated domain/membrane-associated phospholipid phosphatase